MRTRGRLGQIFLRRVSFNLKATRYKIIVSEMEINFLNKINFSLPFYHSSRPIRFSTSRTIVILHLLRKHPNVTLINVFWPLFLTETHPLTHLFETNNHYPPASSRHAQTISFIPLSLSVSLVFPTNDVIPSKLLHINSTRHVAVTPRIHFNTLHVYFLFIRLSFNARHSRHTHTSSHSSITVFNDIFLLHSKRRRFLNARPSTYHTVSAIRIPVAA